GLELAGSVLGTPLPLGMARLIAADATVGRLAMSIRARLFEPGYEPPSIFRLSRFGWRLRERRRDQLLYALRTVATPRVQHFGIVKLPAPLFFAYVPIKLVHDF